MRTSISDPRTTACLSCGMGRPRHRRSSASRIAGSISVKKLRCPENASIIVELRDFRGRASRCPPLPTSCRTADANGRLVWEPGVEWTGGGLVSTPGDLARLGHALIGGDADAYSLSLPCARRRAGASDAPDILYGAGVAIQAQTPRGQAYGHGTRRIDMRRPC